ncbi:archaeal proteasome endopeptidase complex subunit beta [Methanotrichaceae archaeon M04Ac]|jgi:proteasome beta subunit|uniref:Proteasome subunit beta n=1 Tax=Candidatus Methanocrinis alkalitolerans TaxID=3033395 RepID=A0ABT5XEY5_9EURY|nr:archaeal proteasome endopeptidase complex subunit beta [Candidatus Methanocrinis alkalitolerans]MCR3884041.1 archaeal proteasome endopeptidase complex subunit beta [Methanothrix sp.]MDF0593097.1 archaeal proteasome endopeptidase complex subunit beta [Candidatus Methanocrinis alkalitolerans]
MVEVFKGTTTVGIVCKDGVVLASESRATMGHFIASTTAQKIYQLAERVGLTTAGVVGDAQSIVRMIQVESRLYNMQRGEPMTVKGTATLLSNVLASRRYFPFMVQLLLGGVDKKGPKLFSLDALGGQIEEHKVVATGSGSPTAYGVLEALYDPKMDVEEGAKLGIRAIHNAIKRDSASGDVIQVVKITGDGYEVADESSVENIRRAL